MPGNIGPLEVLIVLIIALVVFGPKRLPELGRSLGKGIREFRDSISGDENDLGRGAQPERAIESGQGEEPANPGTSGQHGRSDPMGGSGPT